MPIQTHDPRAQRVVEFLTSEAWEEVTQPPGAIRVNIEAMIAHIGPFIAERRAQLDMSLEDVAERAGTTKSHIWELEKGRSRNPTLGMVLALCRALQCSLNSLLGSDVSKPQFTDQEMALIAAHREIFKL